MIYIIFNKPFNVLSQFKDDGERLTLKNFIQHPSKPRGVGRLDYDSEGLLLLTDDIVFIQKITNPKNKIEKEYHVQVEGLPGDDELNPLRYGLKTKKELYRPAYTERIAEPEYLWIRNPPIRFRKSIPTEWLKIVVQEGKNRQIRKMTAHIGYPTLRLIRFRIGNLTLEELKPGDWKYFSPNKL